MKTKLLNAMSAAILLITPNVNFGQVITLGKAADFVLFSTNGAVTNGLVRSHLTGDIGSNNGPVSGFGNVDGVMHPSSDTATARAAADLLIAYNQLDAAIPDYSPVSTLMGNGDTLTPGVYYYGAPATLDLLLVLDGQGSSLTKFIFQIAGAFTAHTGARVKLINGAVACNVFWKIEGKAEMQSGATMRGNIVANNAEIVMGTNDTLEGRALTTKGAVTVSGVLAYMPLGCGVPVLTGPLAPMLGSTACYALFSGTGAVTGSPTTFVTGDVGTNDGLTTGFDSASVNGSIHPNPDASTQACTDDLLKVYTYLDTVPVDIKLLHPADFGHGLVLTPHTYLLDAATVLTDTLYLNAQDNADAVFIIKTNGAFSTYATHAKVKLINGAQSKNVYWKIQGAFGLSDFVKFVGTVVVDGGAINGLNNGVTFDGRVLTTGGALSANSGTIAATMIPSNCGNGGTVGVSKINAESNSVSIYPNPFSASTNILINDASQINKAELKLYNVLGEMVLNTILTKQLTTIETNNLSSGVYFYKVVSNNITIQSGRLISKQ